MKVSISEGIKAANQLTAIARSLFLFKQSLNLFTSSKRSVSKWLRIEIRATRGTFFVSYEPRPRLLKLLATAEAFGRNCDFRSAAHSVEKNFTSRVFVLHESKNNKLRSPSTPTLASSQRRLCQQVFDK
jgi:hypothetical protein